jgi:hypothetical protein
MERRMRRRAKGYATVFRVLACIDTDRVAVDKV